MIITDALPISTTYVSSDGPVTPTVFGNMLIWNLGRVPGVDDYDSSGYLHFTVRLSEDKPVRSSIVNTVSALTTGRETDYTNNQATAIDTVVAGSSSLYLFKSLKGSHLALGSEVTYLLSYSNWGSDVAPKTVVTDTLPAGVGYVSSTGAGQPRQVGNNVIWNLGPVDHNAQGTITVTAFLSNSLSIGAKITNTATIGSSNNTNLSYNTSSHSGTVEAATRNLGVDAGPQDMNGTLGNAVIGSNLSYMIIYQNYGTASARNAVLTYTLPTGMSFVSTDVPADQSGNRLI